MRRIRVTVRAMHRVNSYTSTQGAELFSMSILAKDALSRNFGACAIARTFAKTLGHTEVSCHYEYLT
jgi:hypothetical protein